MRLFFAATSISGFLAGALNHNSSNNNNNNNNLTFASCDKKDTITDAVSMSLNFSEHRKKKREERQKEKQEQEQEKTLQQQTSSNNNTNNPNAPVRLVIVGGGYSGCQLACKLDSVFDVTLIDEKNFLENRMEMVKVLCSPWDNNAANADPAQRSQSIAAACHFIHRVYLRRANVVTGRVEYVQFDPPSGRKKTKKAASIMNNNNNNNITAAAATETSSSQQPSSLISSLKSVVGINSSTNSSDDQEKKFVRLKDGRKVPFDLIVFATGEEHAFPFSTKQKTSDQRQAEVKHFCEYLARCHKVAVVGGGPLGCSVAGYLASGRPDMSIDLFNKHPQLLQKLPKNMRIIAEETLAGFSNLKIHHSSTVEDISTHIIDTRSDWDKFMGGGDSSKNLAKAIELTTLKEQQLPETTSKSSSSPSSSSPSAEAVDISFDLQVRKYPEPPKQKNPSIFVRCWMGNDFRGEMPALDPDEKYRRADERLRHSTLAKEKGYDYVFVCTGGNPRSELFLNSPELRGHVDGKGHVRVSKYFQLYGYPEAFALGRDCALPFTRSIGNSNLMANTMFRAMMSRFGEGASSNQVMSKMSQDAHCIVPQRFAVPRIAIPLGPNQNVSCGAWYGPTGGENALKELKAEENLFREFRAPKFFKAQNPQKVRERYDKWSETASTPVIDFTYTAELI